MPGLNPETPLALLPPELADQLRIAEYVTVGTLAGFIWDVLCNAHNDWKLVFKCRIGMGTWAYFIARLCTMFYLIISTLLLTYPVGDCALAYQIYTSASAIAVPANTLLMFLRARAIFNNNKYLVFFLLFLWLSVAGTAILPAIPGVAVVANIGPTKYCFISIDQPIAWRSAEVSFTAAPIIYDTVIFVAISWRMFHASYMENRGGNCSRKTKIMAGITGKHLPRFSKAVLRDGQAYYLVTLLVNLPAALVSYNSHIYQTMLFVCTVMVTNCMTSYVFRNTKLGYLDRIMTTTEMSGIEFAGRSRESDSHRAAVRDVE
ncbi:hypothetical protein R3P38DRAFT_3240011 [Favolaschia claudopus]|uniref:Uncharacterized protein n=1 Tax=Favolaschia claudopus TaxID=2862362 RepID=A0AAV9Z7N4_9AGAR